MTEMTTPRSFFVGPTHWWRGRERRNIRRWIKAVVRKGDTEPVELVLSLQALGQGAIYITSNASKMLQYPTIIGGGMILFGLLGLYGLTWRKMAARCGFGFLGVFIRMWMASAYLLHDWTDPIWFNYLIGAALSGWIGSRMVCEAVLRHEFCRGKKDG